MPKFRIKSPDGRTFDVEGPEGSTAEQALAHVQATYKAAPAAPVADLPAEPMVNMEAAKDTAIDTAKNIGMGALSGAANIGATIAAPVDWLTGTDDRRQKLKEFFTERASPESVAFKTGELGAEIAGTAGVGGALAKAPWLARYAPRLAEAIRTGGFTLGGTPAATFAGKAVEAATRAAGGAVVGGASAGLINPKDAPAGAVIGGALPAAVKVAGTVGKAIAPKAASAEVAALAQRANELGIDIPADRISNSRPLNAAAASLNYIPLSGRAGTEAKMFSQFNRAVSRTIGQNTDNMTAALKRAEVDLGTKFERTLSSNTVKYDTQFVDDLVGNLEKARMELTEDQAKLIGKITDDIFQKANPIGNELVIDGQAAYNIKKTLDRIGNRASNEAFYARELKKSLMGALDRSLGPTEAVAFKELRQQYGNMLDLQGLVPRGAEGGISIGKLANVRDLNPELGELSDIAAQFLKSREGPHGAAQRVGLGLIGIPAATATGTIPVAAGMVAGGRAANMALNSQTMKNAMLGRSGGARNKLLEDPAIRALIYTQANQASP